MNRLAQRGEQLTSFECDVLRLVAEGYTSAEIAKQLHYSSETVRSQLKRIYVKLGANNRSHAAAIGLRTGLVPMEEEQ